MARLAEGNEECQNSKCEFYDKTAWQRCGGDLAGEPAIASCLNWASSVTRKPEEWKNGAADFACYLINNCERETITEEFIQQALVDFAKEAVRMSEAEARVKIEEFLTSEGWQDSYNLEFHEASDPEDSTWAFWTVDSDGDSSEYTSYLHMDGSIESYGL